MIFLLQVTLIAGGILIIALGGSELIGALAILLGVFADELLK